MLARLESLLRGAAVAQVTLTYGQIAQMLDLSPPRTIHQTTELLSELMRRHANAGVPQLASLVISRTRGGLPAPGFFVLLGELGIYSGSVDGEDAREFHHAEKQRCYAAWPNIGEELE